MRFVLLFLICLSSPLLAEVGDTITIVAHDQTDMVWNQRYDEEVVFNLNTVDIAEAKMSFTLGCASSHCSDWDYTVHVYVGLKDGTLDSTINTIDTLSIEPLLVDTTWNYSDHHNYFQLGRLITPYGTYMNSTNGAYGIAGFDDTWTHEYEFDVSDYVGLLQNEARIRIHYDGWSEGFSGTVKFEFIEGTPARKPLSVQNILGNRNNNGAGGFGYTSEAELESGILAPDKVYIPEGTESARINVWYSGHGADNQGCAEFCERSYTLKVEGDEIANQSLWRDDCGLNPLYPQGGTWIYNRGNWCPGDKVERYEHDVTAYAVPGDSMEYDFDIGPHYNTNGGASFSFNVQLVTYGPSNFTHDVAIVDIISPSTKDAYSRRNPICGEPIIKIKNNGTSNLISCWIRYGVVAGIDCWHYWTGNLKAQEETEVTLPLMNWFNLDDDPRFFAEVSFPGGQGDEYAENNIMYSQVEKVTNYEEDFVIFFRTNNRPEENSWELLDSEGNVLESDDDFFANFEYEVPIDVEPGCYTFVFKDFDAAYGGGDGLAWWANADETAGVIRIQDQSGAIIENLEADFGSEVRINFTRGYDQGSEPFGVTCETYSGINDPEIQDSFTIYPNPNEGSFVIALDDSAEIPNSIEVYSTEGRKVFTQILSTGDRQINLTMPDVQSGVYFVKLIGDKSSLSWRSMVIK